MEFEFPLELLTDAHVFVNEAHSQISELLSSQKKRQPRLSSVYAEMDYITVSAVDAMISKAIQLLSEGQLELRKSFPRLPPPMYPLDSVQSVERIGLQSHSAQPPGPNSGISETPLQMDNTQIYGSYVHHLQSACKSSQDSFHQLCMSANHPIHTSSEPDSDSLQLQSAVTMPYHTPVSHAQSQMPKIGYKRPRSESEPSVPGDHWLWRKYGQKVIKFEGIVRRYYRCAYKDGDTVCLAKRQVDCREDGGKIVAVKYEGKYNHEIPSSKVIVRIDPEDSSAVLTGD